MRVKPLRFARYLQDELVEKHTLVGFIEIASAPDVWLHLVRRPDGSYGAFHGPAMVSPLDSKDVAWAMRKHHKRLARNFKRELNIDDVTYLSAQDYGNGSASKGFKRAIETLRLFGLLD